MGSTKDCSAQLFEIIAIRGSSAFSGTHAKTNACLLGGTCGGMHREHGHVLYGE